MSKTSAVLAKITTRKVRIFFYLNEQELKFQSATDKFMVAAVSFANELERELASQRSRDAALKRAREGRNFGGRVFGYDNVWLYLDGREVTAVRGKPKEKEAQTLYRINAGEADVVRAIFRMYSAGYGLGSIAKALNRDERYVAESKKYFRGVVPRAPYSRTGSWSGSSLLGILGNARYTGKVPFGKSHRYQDIEEGTKKRNWNTGREEMFGAPDLRIVTPALWQAVQKRRAAARKTYLTQTKGARWGRRTADGAVESKYLLTGLARCGCCSANVVIVGGRAGGSPNKRPIYYYGCSYYQNRGRTVCANDYRVRMEPLGEGILHAVEQQLLEPKIILPAIERALAIVAERRREQPDRAHEIDVQLKRIGRELRNLGALAAGGKVPKTILEEISTREADAETLQRELAELRAAAVEPASLMCAACAKN